MSLPPLAHRTWTWSSPCATTPPARSAPSGPATAHWGYADPSAGDGSDADKAEAFRKTLHAIQQRLELLVNLPGDKLAATALQATARDLPFH